MSEPKVVRSANRKSLAQDLELTSWTNSSLTHHLITMTFSFLHHGIRVMLPFLVALRIVEKTNAK